VLSAQSDPRSGDINATGLYIEPGATGQVIAHEQGVCANSYRVFGHDKHSTVTETNGKPERYDHDEQHALAAQVAIIDAAVRG
jgi:hypothetical protein